MSISTRRFLRMIAVLLILTGWVCSMARAQTLTLFCSFDFKYPNPCDPIGTLVQGSNGNFYGITNNGREDDGGTVFKCTPGGSLTTFYSFVLSATAFTYPNGGLVEGSNGNFYGTAYETGSHKHGTIFKLTSLGQMTTLYAFTGGANGSHPQAPLVRGAYGDFYGTTAFGGAYNLGTIFKITPSGALTKLHTFSGGDGAVPIASLCLGRDGDFYGTTSQGGKYNAGTVFKISPRGALPSSISSQGGIRARKA